MFSSSSGNCTYVGTAHGGILIDVGVSAKRTAQALDCIGVSPENIGAIFVTHEHTDHVKGLRVFTKQHPVPVFASGGTLRALEESDCFEPGTNVMQLEGSTEVMGMYIRAFHTPHDSRESVGYVISMPDGRRIAVATDLGTVTPEVESAVTGCDLVLLESNHDKNMLMANERYPYQLKRRILSDVGHLSNNSCAQLACKLVSEGTTRLVLGHLSHENNYPRLAYECTGTALSEQGMKQGNDYLLSVAGSDEMKMTVM